MIFFLFDVAVLMRIPGFITEIFDIFFKYGMHIREEALIEKGFVIFLLWDGIEKELRIASGFFPSVRIQSAEDVDS